MERSIENKKTQLARSRQYGLLFLYSTILLKRVGGEGESLPQRQSSVRTVDVTEDDISRRYS